MLSGPCTDYTGAFRRGERRSKIGTLFLVATPIGNLEDITLRALRVLREVPLIAAEDTRHSRRLLHHYNIETPMISFHQHSDPARHAAVLDALDAGDVALISDAGTPGISDPGFALVVSAIERGFEVSPVPGPAAMIAAVPSSGLVPNGFLFLGFLPRRQKERRQALEQLRELRFPLVIYEAPHRLSSCLGDIEHVLGDRPLAIARELTKLHEELIHTSVSEARKKYAEDRPRGEFVLVIGAEGESQQLLEIDSDNILQLLEERMRAGDTPSAAARNVAKQTGLPRSDLYARTQEVDREN